MGNLGPTKSELRERYGVDQDWIDEHKYALGEERRWLITNEAFYKSEKRDLKKLQRELKKHTADLSKTRRELRAIETLRDSGHMQNEYDPWIEELSLRLDALENMLKRDEKWLDEEVAFVSGLIQRTEENIEAYERHERNRDVMISNLKELGEYDA